MTRYEWDEEKNQINFLKHGISFDTAILIFEDPHVVSELDRIVSGEERWQSIGAIGNVVIVLVAHTWEPEKGSDELIRVISARKATRNERRKYEESR
jgi:uncharacterized protein